MLKKFSSYLGVFVLVCFSFYYTDRAVDLIKKNDPIRQSIESVAKQYELDPISAMIDGNEIMPGLNGKKVNIDKSYQQMKRLNEFHESMLVFDEVIPETNLQGQYDKFIIKGNQARTEVALLFTAANMTNLENVYKILLEKNAVATFFLDGTLIENNMDFVNDLVMDGNQIENLGYDGSYTKERFQWTNNMIESITKVDPKYCYVDYHNYEVLNFCSKQKMYTVLPTAIAVNYPFATAKASLANGSVIAFSLTDRTVKELPAILSFIEQKGYTTVSLSQALSEYRSGEK